MWHLHRLTVHQRGLLPCRKTAPRSGFRQAREAANQQQLGRLPPGSFSSRNLPVGFRAARVDRLGGNGEKWWDADRQLFGGAARIAPGPLSSYSRRLLSFVASRQKWSGLGMTSPLFGLFAAIALTSAMAEQAPDGRYSDQMFREAVYNRQGTSQPFVLVTIIDGSTGAEKKGCTEIGALAAAVALQKGWTRDRQMPTEDEVDEFLIKRTDRRFTFYQAKWLAGSGYYSIEHNEAACAFLRRGISAFRADLTGQIVPGTPGHRLAGIPLQTGS